MRPPIPPVQPVVKRTSHTFHLIMSVITIGMWALFVWWWVAMVIDHGNAKRARQYARELAEYEAKRFEWESRQREARGGRWFREME